MESQNPNQSDKQKEENQEPEVTGNSLKDFPKEDLLDMQKGAAAMDKFGGNPEKITGKTLSGAGSGPGTGDWGGDFDRPGTEGLPAQNDYVEHELPPDKDVSGSTADFDEVSGALAGERREKPENPGEVGDEASGFPGGGAVRTAEDRIPAPEQDENTGWSPESPLNRPHNPMNGGRPDPTPEP